MDIKRFVLPVLVQATWAGAPILINLALVQSVDAQGSHGAIRFLDGDSHVISETPEEFGKLAADALDEAIRRWNQ